MEESRASLPQAFLQQVEGSRASLQQASLQQMEGFRASLQQASLEQTMTQDSQSFSQQTCFQAIMKELKDIKELLGKVVERKGSDQNEGVQDVVSSEVFVGDRLFEIKVPKISIIEAEHSAKNSQALARNLLDCLLTKREQADRTCYGSATKNRIQLNILRAIRSINQLTEFARHQETFEKA
ncbi:uncharacterized protein LOC134188538 [Corticium candelabrum]|uniref:uncharacterized protein LOC134188538 n=1 Tax=Corticium candelabrum TaxID=121492 RepID=UPI002E25AA86|nr:uncharacterized protein LOC134188538 [Corticium candelabrum]